MLHFRFVYFLTLLHVLFTVLGMHCFAAAGMYQKKALPVRPLLALSLAFVGYIVMWNVSLQVWLKDPHLILCLADMIQIRLHSALSAQDGRIGLTGLAWRTAVLEQLVLSSRTRTMTSLLFKVSG